MSSCSHGSYSFSEEVEINSQNMVSYNHVHYDHGFDKQWLLPVKLKAFFYFLLFEFMLALDFVDMPKYGFRDHENVVLLEY